MSRSTASILYVAFATVAVGIFACGTMATETPVPPASRPQSPPAQTSDPRPNPTFTSAPDLKSARGAEVFIRLADSLDEPGYYCLDIPGAGGGVRLDSPLQAHTCKPVAVAADELFTMDQPSDLQIYMQAYDLCLASSGLGAGAVLLLQSCSDSPFQRFVYTPDGHISPKGQDQICLAIDPGPGLPAGRSLRRDVRLENCEGIEPSLARWQLDEPDG